MKYKIFPLALVLFLVLTVPVLAATQTLPYFGTTSESSYLYANSSTGQDTFTSVQYCARGSATIEYVKVGGGSNGSDSVSEGCGTVSPPGNTGTLKLVSGGAEIYLVQANTTNPNATTITFETPDNPPSSDNSGGSDDTGADGGAACSTAICECIGDLKGATGAVGDAVAKNGEKLDGIKDAVNSNGDKVKQAVDAVGGAVGDVLGELQSDTMPPEFSREIPNLADAMPGMATDGFEDKNKYFEDGGSEPVNAGMPQAPEPEKWDGVEEQAPMNPEDELSKDSELSKDEEKKKDEENKRDEELAADRELDKDKYEQDGELEKDQYQQDGELDKDDFTQTPELDTDRFNQSPELSQDARPSLDREMEPDRQMEADKQLQRDTEYNQNKYEQDLELSRDGVGRVDEFQQDDIITRDRIPDKTWTGFERTEWYNYNPGEYVPQWSQ